MKELEWFIYGFFAVFLFFGATLAGLITWNEAYAMTPLAGAPEDFKMECFPVFTYFLVFFIEKACAISLNGTEDVFHYIELWKQHQDDQDRYYSVNPMITLGLLYSITTLMFFGQLFWLCCGRSSAPVKFIFYFFSLYYLTLVFIALHSFYLFYLDQQQLGCPCIKKLDLYNF